MIKLASPDIQEKDIKNLIEVLQSGNLVEGKNVATFEEDIAKFTGIKHCTVTSSATAGLHLILKALGISKGDWVIVPSFTFPATASVVENVGAKVLFCDVDQTSYVVQPKMVEKCIKNNADKNIKAIIVVHEFGYPVQMKELSKIAKEYNLKLIEDAACALGTISNGKHVGYYSDGAVFSFHPRKAITSGEGGAVVSRKKKTIEQIKILKNHGIKRSENGIDFVEAGLNYRLSDFQAALMIGQLERFKDELAKRKQLSKVYCEQLQSVPYITLPKSSSSHSWQSYMIVLDKQIDRSSVIQYLLQHNIQSNLGAQSLPMLSYYKKKYSIKRKDHKISDVLYQRGLVLPLYGKLNKQDICYICNKLKEYLAQYQ
jgi:dTDP-4-amino-4,6-dideoxygalactose transaminase